MPSIYYVLKRIFHKPLHLQADFARESATEVAALASQGLISTACGPNRFDNKWRITGMGLEALREEGVL